MRVLLLDQFSEMGGAQRCLADLIPALLRRGWDLRGVLPGDGPFVDFFRLHGVHVDSVPCGPYAYGHKTPADVVRFAHDQYSAVRKIAQMVEEQRTDLVYVNGPRLASAAARSARGTPVIFHSHSYLSKSYATRLIGRELRRDSVSVIASSEYVAQPWIRFTGRERLAVVYNGTPEIAFQSRRFPAGDVWRIGVIGRIAPEKGQLEFARAARLLAQSGARARFLVHGAPMLSSPKYTATVRTAAEGLPVDFTGWHDSVDSILHELDLVVVPSPLHESTTRVILEAFSAGTPVIAFPSGGIPEVVEHGVTGFLTVSRSPEALATAVRDAMGRSDELSTITAAARRKWEQRYTVPRFCNQIMELMESAVWRNNRRNNTAASKANTAAVPNTGE